MRWGDPEGEVGLAYGVMEAITAFYETPNAEQATDLLRDIIEQCSKKSSPPGLRRLARSLGNWFDQITAWH